MADDHRKNPYPSFRFKATINGIAATGFNDISGLTFDTEVQTFREGGFNYGERQLAGPTKYSSRLTLKRGLADVDELWSWYSDVMAGTIKRKDIRIILLDQNGNEKWGWSFANACPVKWTGPTLQAAGSQVAFESLELVHDGLQPGTTSGLKR